MTERKKSSGVVSSEDIRHSTLVNWCNCYLGDFKIKNIEKDFLANFVDVIHSVDELFQPTLANKLSKDAIEETLQFLRDQQIKLPKGFSSRDVLDGKEDVLLDFVWDLVRHYDIYNFHLRPRSANEGDLTEHSLLHAWLIYNGLEVHDFSTSWQDGTQLFRLVSSFTKSRPTSPLDAFGLVQWCLTVAAEELKVPGIVLAEHVVSEAVDEISMLAYIGVFRKVTTPEDELKDRYYPLEPVHEQPAPPPPPANPQYYQGRGSYGAPRYDEFWNQRNASSSRNQQSNGGEYLEEGSFAHDLESVTDTEQIVEYQINLPGWEGEFNTPPHSRDTKYFPINVLKSKLASYRRLEGPAWLHVHPDEIMVLDQQSCAAKLVCPLNSIRRYGKDGEVFSVEVGDHGGQHPGVLYFETSNQASEIFDFIKKYTSEW